MTFWEWIGLSNSKPTRTEQPVAVRDLCLMDAEISIRDCALSAAVNMLADAVSRCEFITYKNGKPVKEAEYYTWNIEPNANQNASAFLAKLISKLVRENEALVFDVTRKKAAAGEWLFVADGFTADDAVIDERKYSNVQCDDLMMVKTFRESEVLHFVLNDGDIANLVRSLAGKKEALLQAAEKKFFFDNGKHLIVHVDQVVSGDAEFEKKFTQIMNEQVRPWMKGNNAVLPEYNGYAYRETGKSSDASTSTGDMTNLTTEIFEETFAAIGIPSVLALGKVEATGDAQRRFMNKVDTILRQIEKEVNRKRYTFEEWRSGTYMRIDSSRVNHFDYFEQAANIEKQITSGVRSVNDILAAIGENRINAEWADAHWMAMNVSRLE